MTASASRSPLSRRSLLAASAATGLALCESALAAPAAPGKSTEAAVLTISGPGVRGNRGPLDPVADLLLKNHGLAFDSAWTTGAHALERLPTVEITPHIEYDGQPHRLRGPLLATVLQAAGVDSAAAAAKGQWITLQAIDGYRAQLPLAQALQWSMLLATHMDGRRLGLGGLGPQWAMYDADRIADLAGKPLKERFAQAPWGLYHMGLHAQQPQG
ncbi:MULTISPECIES: molybdopterin-dependent oxidoreductase [Delftia]|uniref:molybdopterin-dependent oxidoreductase n=1 Tax=Delftia TaxID=80865 RepID=UPI0018EAEF0A|nr:MULTISPECIES: molybdopterin-dependent oxidoreductase [Delftia]